MSGETDLRMLLGSMDPQLSEERYVFHSMSGSYAEIITLEPWAIITENEGLTIIIEENTARLNGIPVLSIFKRITLNIHSSLEAVGLTAAISTALAEAGISANVVAGFYHDHVFVQEHVANEALRVLRDLST
jgi:uncharacterized protein